ncbi:MAG: FMN-binding protein [Treponema sp.]|nr:FMN-binding protein [Treponema sp.]MCL2252611.1 FMN-binding protein [Treponema sp.]
MKYILFFALVFLLLGTLFIQGCIILKSNQPHEGGINISDEMYEGTGQGYRGPISVQVRMNGDEIAEIIVIDSEEDHFVGGQAIEELIDLVILYNSTDLDAISGATETSKGFLEAAENAIMKK